MNSIDSNSNGLYYNSTQAAQAQAAQAQAQSARRFEKNKAVKKPSFSSIMRQQQAQSLLESQGLPPEIAGLGQEEAIVYLKDRLDEAGDALSESATGQAFENYKKAVGQFVRFMQKNNFRLDTRNRAVLDRNGKIVKNADGKTKVKPLYLIETIDKKLEELNRDIWFNHLDKLRLLEKIHEINGLVVDLTVV